MSPPTTVFSRRQSRPAAVHMSGCTSTYNEDTRECTLLVRSHEPIDKCKTILLDMTEPQPGEECCIVMEPIAEYAIDGMQPLQGLQGVIKDHPLLTKATMPCGHGFSAVALLYHFARNEMTCPCCRGGHSKVRMSRLSIPLHIRPAMVAQLKRSLDEERAEQIESDAAVVTGILEREVTNPAPFSRAGRRMLILHAFASADSSRPIMVQEIPLMSSRTSTGRLQLSSSGAEMREVNRNLRLLPVRVQGYELMVVCMSGSIRSVRFALSQDSSRVACVAGGDEVMISVHPNLRDGSLELERVVLTMPSNNTVSTVLANALALWRDQ